VRTEPATIEQQVRPEDEVPELRADAAPTLTVTLSRSALHEICDELNAIGRALLEDGLETGGSLIGRQVRRVLEVLDASGPASGPDDGSARRFIDGVRISSAPGYGIARDLARHFSDARIVPLGAWHSHPIRKPEPSGVDRRSALLALEQLERELGWRAPNVWIDLIVTPGLREGFRSPRVFGWATRRLPWSGAITEPVRVTEA
jgi:hypothetical protein